MDNLVNKQLIFEHFANRVTALQRQMIAEWLQHPENKEHYYAWLEEWENRNPQYAIEVETKLQQSVSRLITEQTPLYPQVDPNRPNRFLSVWQWAAVFAGLLLLGGLYTGRSYIEYRSVYTGYGEVRQVDLPDGSTVTLNANSSIRYARFGFGNQARRVHLVGEASFAVKHLSNQAQFVVSTEHNLDVIVLGTVFSVFSRPRGAKVVLQRGKVEIVQTAHRSARHITLKPGDLISLDSSGFLSMKHLPHPDAYAAWQEHQHEFDQTTLSEIAGLLEKTYGMQVTVADSALAQRTVSGTFSTRTATELSRVIADLLDVAVSQKGNQITFTKPLNP
ncbi:FecR family protein [Spirosoma validum]|uniref:FecR domain-containing protein n=1 Tax=Spirosoma validum TaxID=2771355 RepID=A0A927GF34_9BACT|nr:FecR domain-containing protein [Spirosoma validum]MBD2755424.1 FecR domain-containing protein [Spirosoma validum]